MDNYPNIKNEYLVNDSIEITNEITNYFVSYLEWGNNMVNFIQNKSNNYVDVPLSFYPIAKNIRFVSSHMINNILNNKKSVIFNTNRHNEQIFWENELNRGPINPWLWCRGRILDENNKIKENYTNHEGWTYYFDSFSKESLSNNNYTEKTYIEPEEKYKMFFLYLACLKYTFVLNDKYLNMIKEYKEKVNWPDNSKILAVQIRRGDVSTKSGSKSCREYFSLNDYIEKIDKLLEKNNYDYIYISTDSEISELENDIKLVRPNWKLIFLPFKREDFFRMDENASILNNGYYQAQELEDSCRLNPDKIPFIVDTGLMDLYFISICQGYISTMSESEFSKLGWFLQIIEQKKITPYINMNTKKLNFDEKDALLLF